jgi:hypothetical protein
MKTIKLIVFGMILMFAGSMQAQLSVRVNIGTPPTWGPAGYNSVRYYYLPDIESYYDVQNSMFIYYSGRSWIHSRTLPARYRNYDLYGGYKVVMNDYRGNRPYDNFRQYRVKYAKGYRGHEQRNIGERNDNRGRGHEAVQPNRVNNRAPERYNNQSQVRGNDKGHDKGNDKDKKDGRDNGNRK